MRPTTSDKLDAALLLAQTDWVRDLARSLISPQHADDVAQEAILIALDRPPRAIEDESGLRAWLARVVRNLGRAAVRGDAHRRAREQDVARPESQPSVAETVARASQLRAVVDEVIGLDEPYRDAVLLRYFEQLGAKEIAEITGTTPAAARMRVSRGLDQLRARLDGDEGGQGRSWLSGLAGLGASDVRGTAAGATGLTPTAALALGVALLAALPLALLLGRLGAFGDPVRDVVAVEHAAEGRLELTDNQRDRGHGPSTTSGAELTAKDPMHDTSSATLTQGGRSDRPNEGSKMKAYKRLLAIPALTAIVPTAHAQWSTDALSVPRNFMAATSVDGKAFFAGGTGLNNTRVDVYDPHSDPHWTQHELSVGRADLTATSLGPYAFFAGGNPGTNVVSVDVVDVYDSTLGPPTAAAAWSVVHLSEPRTEFCSTAVGSKVLFAGGIVTGNPLVYSDVVDVYDSAVGAPNNPAAWTVDHLTIARANIGATAVGTKALFAGGDTALGGVTYDLVDIYDDSTGTWSTTVLSKDRGYISAVTVGTQALFAGGYDCCSWAVADVDIYDDSTGAWSQTSLSLPRSFLASTAVGDLALFAGGWPPVTDRVDIYDSVSQTWSTTSMSIPHWQHAATSVDGIALFAGGDDDNHNSVDVVEVFDLDFGERYCSPAVANSSGSPGVIVALGTTNVSLNDCSLTARELPPNQFGYFLNAQTQANTFPVPNSQGALCVGGAIGRYNANVFNTGATGTGSLQLDLANTPTPTGTVAIQAGETWNFTAWYRDVNPNATSNFTDGVSITFQ